MNQAFKILEFDKIINKLKEYAFTENAKRHLEEIKPYLSESELEHSLLETTQARIILDTFGNPPLVSLNEIEDILIAVRQGGFITPKQLEYIGITLTAVMRLKDFLKRCKQLNISLPYYEEQLDSLEQLRYEIGEKIRAERVDDYASKLLRSLRQDIEQVDAKMRQKAESILKSNKECFTDSYITQRSGRICLPVKKECKFKISGSTIDKSSTGATLFIEPTVVSKLNDELINLRLDEENEERRILYSLASKIHDEEEVFYENIRVIEKLDFIFAKGKLSFDMKGVTPEINTRRWIKIINGRHPFLDPDQCVALNFEMGDGINGVIITGPNTGGKTVAIKTVGLLSIMAQCGLHVPCEAGNFAMNSQYLCDIGDGQNITENLSTFSAHITNILSILQKANHDSLVIVDELGSGTDPTEGMGIAIAILEELRKSECLYLATTHYPEVKAYAEKTQHVMNARMAFDRESLKPLYRLEVGKAGESCALQIAKRLGMPSQMLITASKAAYGEEQSQWITELNIKEDISFKQSVAPKLQRKKEKQPPNNLTEKFSIGDSVMILPDNKIGIVCMKVNEKGILQVQLREKKIWINHKRVKLHVRAEELYPDGYDFSIVFDSVATRKARHQMERKYDETLEIKIEE
ncbi:endonuclease MutS2 [Lachnotalea glycerini]|uniref:DNA mismatch repair protein MutS n=1 Tax=Lachnotalea glycerini TaxID=1763509 RepID=A0A371JB58_9FIRM|nr:DNA mismatch repair protein MutS [Lachnotalea glycerini]RDY29953.1 DNA mismatch repair protein MutS [Lachnotalea glycerini]